MNKIRIIGDIDEDVFLEFCERMDELESESSEAEDVEITLNSIGGNALDAVAIASRIRLSPLPVNVTVYGVAASAAVLILAACDKRRMTSESWVMVHEDAHTVKNISTSKIEQEARIARAMEDQWSSLLSELTGTSKEVWLEHHKNGDLWLSPVECVKLGLVDEVI